MSDQQTATPQQQAENPTEHQQAWNEESNQSTAQHSASQQRQGVEQRRGDSQRGQGVEQRRGDSQREALRPPVDVFEDDASIVLTADLPGVSNDGLNIEIDSDTLLIEGEASLNVPDETRPLYAEVRNVSYRRSFALSSELDTEEVEANLQNGVLTLRLPKRAEAQPRKIEVKTG